MKTKISALILCAFMLISLCACAAETTGNDETTVTETPEKNNETAVESTAAEEAGLWADAVYTEDTEFGDGEKTIKVLVIAEEKTVTFTIKTDEETLGAALLAHSLVEGENGAYGLYIKKVNGITADYDVDGYYWGLTKNGEYVMSGADTTNITDGEQYELTRTK